ncbi:hypothetical protein PILCRDRAFT_1228 [Piloderma croceum F 1598]|uniref:Uncharacterized protein n=1 Tax=Piloderma croceum (strain F 1598) TaxID=765440 RepID=A0A0C3CMV3_PILCF|nr:hypothetical protein PILCRDRAFT_1228 [Piloderma croceum F 1598]
MSTSALSSPPSDDSESFFSTILKPGSSLHPTFLLIVDGAFAFLLVVFIALAFMTAGNIHIFALMGIELALWASIKWFVYELQNSPPITAETEESKKTS